MKYFSIAFIISALSLPFAVFANVGDVYVFGQGNVIRGAMSNNTNLRLFTAAEPEHYFELNCTTSLLGKNRLTFKKFEIQSQRLVVIAEAKVKNCSKTLVSVYQVAFESKSHAVIALTEKPLDKGVYGLSVSFSTSVETVNQ